RAASLAARASVAMVTISPIACRTLALPPGTASVRSIAADLGAMHHPLIVVLERVAAMHRTAIVPDHDIAFAPDLGPPEFRSRRLLPKLVQQRLAVVHRESRDVG